MGVGIVMKAMRAPARTIAENAVVEGDVVIEAVMNHEITVGYNAMENKIGDMFDQGIIDPTKVTRNGIQNSCSIAGLMLTTQAVMYVLPKNNPLSSVKYSKTKDTGSSSEWRIPPGLTI